MNNHPPIIRHFVNFYSTFKINLKKINLFSIFLLVYQRIYGKKTSLVATSFKKYFFIFLGFFFLVLGIIGAFLPILPTTPFILLAAASFAKGSPRFHHMLLNNSWFGPTLKEWETSKTVSKKSKTRAIGMIILSFSFSIYILRGRLALQIMLAVLGFFALIIISRLKEKT